MRVIIFLWLSFLYGCTHTDPFVSTYLLEDQWLLEQIIAPNYPFPEQEATNPITISFPKNEEYELILKTKSCSGIFIAQLNGEIEFKRTCCSILTCDSDWDHYFITLLKKVTHFTVVDDNNLKLFINKENYLLFNHQKNTMSPLTF